MKGGYIAQVFLHTDHNTLFLYQDDLLLHHFIHQLVNKMIVLLSEDLLIEFLLCHADVPSLQHLSKVNYEYVNALLYCTYAISYT